jgi:hypothetical protein
MKLVIIYIIALFIFKIYTAWPVFSLRNQDENLIRNQVQKRNQLAVTILARITVVLLIYVSMTIVSGLFSIMVGDNFYDIFKHRATIAEAYDEETEGKFSYGSYSIFKFALRVIILNLVIIKPIFGIGLLNRYTKDKN